MIIIIVANKDNNKGIYIYINLVVGWVGWVGWERENSRRSNRVLLCDLDSDLVPTRLLDGPAQLQATIMLSSRNERSHHLPSLLRL